MFIDMRAQCFMAAAKSLNFTRAAEKLYISQPALSKNIAALEEECNMKLFYRDSKRNSVKLTPGGAVLMCEFQKMMDILDGVIDKAQRAESGQEGHLTIAILQGQIINDITTEVLQTIDEQYPKIDVKKIMGGFRDLRTWLEDGTADMIVTFEEEARLVEGIIFDEVANVQIGLLIPRTHHLASKRTIKIKDLEGEKIIIPDERETFAIYDLFKEKCKLEGFKPVELTAANLAEMNMMAEMCKGILITREDSIVTRSPHLKFYKSEELGKAKLVAAWRKDNLNPIMTLYHRMYEDIYIGAKG